MRRLYCNTCRDFDCRHRKRNGLQSWISYVLSATGFSFARKMSSIRSGFVAIGSCGKSGSKGNPSVRPAANRSSLRIGPTLPVKGLTRNGRLIPLSRLIAHGYSIFNNWTASA